MRLGLRNPRKKERKGQQTFWSAFEPGYLRVSQYCASTCVRFGCTHIQCPLREFRSIRSGASGLPYYCAPFVCVSDVIELLAVWRHNKPKTEKLGTLAVWIPNQTKKKEDIYPLHRIKIPTEILLKMKHFRPKTATP